MARKDKNQAPRFVTVCSKDYAEGPHKIVGETPYAYMLFIGGAVVSVSKSICRSSMQANVQAMLAKREKAKMIGVGKRKGR
jgi:hypothetical protein